MVKNTQTNKNNISLVKQQPQGFGFFGEINRRICSIRPYNGLGVGGGGWVGGGGVGGLWGVGGWVGGGGVGGLWGGGGWVGVLLGGWGWVGVGGWVVGGWGVGGWGGVEV